MVTAHLAHQNKSAIVVVTLVGAVLIAPLSVRAASGSNRSCTVGTSCTVGEFLYDDTYAAVTGATCTITSKYPDGTAHLTGQGMAETSGWYAHEFTAPTTTGYYRAQVCCTVSGETMCLDKSFAVEAVAASVPTASDVATAVWGYSGRTMSSFGSMASDVWRYSSRALTSFGTFAQDMWNHNPRTLTSESADLSAVKKTVQENRILLEQIVNKPIIQNSIEEEVPEISEKLNNTKTVADQLYLHEQYIVSKAGVVALKSGQLDVTDLGRVLGEETDSSSAETVFGGIAWMRNSWNWQIADEMYDQARAVRAALNTKNTRSLVAYLYTLETMTGDSTDKSGAKTLFGKINEVAELAQVLDEKKQAADKLLANWTPDKGQRVQSQIESLSKEVLAVNRLPKAKIALSSSFKIDSVDKKIKNKLLGIRGIIDANRMLLARGSSKAMASIWLEEGSVIFKSFVSNPSLLISQTAELKYYLPKEVKKEHILETDAGIDVKYDSEKDQYYVEGSFLLKPGESRVLSIRVDDVWHVSAEELASLRKQAEELARPLEKTGFFAQGVTLKSDIDVSLDKVVALLKNDATPELKIRSYREAGIEMNAAREKISKLKDVVAQASSTTSLFGFVGGSQTMAVWGIIIVALAGFVFLATYMRNLNGQIKPAEEKVEITADKKHGRWGLVVLAALVSAAVTGAVVWQPKEVLVAMVSPEAEVEQPAVLGVGGPDIIRIAVPAGGAVNVRMTAAVGSGVVIRLNKTTEAIRLAEDAKWVQVALDDARQGWVAREFIVEPVK